MGYTFFDYLAGQEQRYRLSIFISVGMAIFSTIVIAVVLPNNSSSLNSYEKYQGAVTKVEYTTIQRPSKSALEFNKLENHRVLMIKSYNKTFYLGHDFAPYWQKVKNQVNINDFITIYYNTNKKNDRLLISQLESNGQIIIPHSFKYKQGVGALITMIIILFLSVITFVGLVRKGIVMKIKLW